MTVSPTATSPPTQPPTVPPTETEPPIDPTIEQPTKAPSSRYWKTTLLLVPTACTLVCMQYVLVAMILCIDDF
jgi:hypothetical protein